MLHRLHFFRLIRSAHTLIGAVVVVRRILRYAGSSELGPWQEVNSGGYTNGTYANRFIGASIGQHDIGNVLGFPGGTIIACYRRCKPHTLTHNTHAQKVCHLANRKFPIQIINMYFAKYTEQ